MIYTQKTKLKVYVIRDYTTNEEIGRFKTSTEAAKVLGVKKACYISNACISSGTFRDSKKNRYTVERIIEDTERKSFFPSALQNGVVQDLPGELWKEVPGFPHNWCSNLGRFKIVDLAEDEYPNLREGVTGTGEMLSPITKSVNKTKKVYHTVSFIGPAPKCNKTKSARCNRVIAKTWLDNSLPIWDKKGSFTVVDHISGDTTDDSVKNLRIVSQAMNLHYAAENGVQLGSEHVKCFAYNVKTKELRKYSSTAELGRDIYKSSNPGYFSAAYNHLSTSSDGWQVFKEGDKYPHPQKKISRKVFAYNIRTHETRRFNKIIDLCRDVLGTDNYGRFDYLYNQKYTTEDGWQVFKEGDTYPYMLVGKFSKIGDVRIYAKGAAYNEKTGKYIGRYNRVGNFLISIPGFKQVSLAKMSAILFLKPEALEEEDKYVVIYKDGNRRNINLKNLRLYSREEYSKLSQEEKLKLKGNKVQTRKKKEFYLYDSFYGDFEATTLEDICKKLNICEGTVRKYCKSEEWIDRRYRVTDDYFEACMIED